MKTAFVSTVWKTYRLNKLTNEHWSVENELWQLDVTFQEEKRVRKEQTPQKLSLLRKIALNLPPGGPIQLKPARKLSKEKNAR